MSLPTRILIGLVLALCALAGVQYGLLSTANARLAKEQAKTKNLEASVRGYKARAAASDRAAARAATRQKELDHAVQANPDWAAAPVPDAVWDSLYGPDEAAR